MRWQPARRRAAGWASGAALLAGLVACAAVEGRWLGLTAAAATVHLAAVVVAAVRAGPLFAPALSGIALCWPVALSQGGIPYAAIVVGGVVLATELLAAASEHAVVVVHDHAAGERRALRAAAVAFAAAGVVAIATSLPQLGGSAAPLVAGAAAALAAALLSR